MKADVSRQYKMLEKILPMVETNMTNDRIISCATKALGMGAGGLLYCRIPADETYKTDKYERKSVVLADMPANAKALHEFIFDSAEEAEDAKVLSPANRCPRARLPYIRALTATTIITATTPPYTQSLQWTPATTTPTPPTSTPTASPRWSFRVKGKNTL